MRTSRFVAIGFLLICALITAAVANGLVSPAAPVAVFPTPPPRPTAIPDASNSVTITVAYSSEKEEWIKQAVEKWRASGPTLRSDDRLIIVELQSMGSQDMVNRLADGNQQFRPTVVIPASSLQIAQINALEIDGKRDTASSPTSLLVSPLVIFAYRGTPADGLVANETLWTQVHDQVAVADRSKRLLFGQTTPDTSNSGLQTLLALAATFHNKSELTAGDINDPAFKTWLREYTRNIAKFGSSTNTFSDDIIRLGGNTYHAVAIYEHLAIERIKPAIGRNLDPRILYPTPAVVSDHPYAILNTSWVTAEQREAADMLREFLLTEESQLDAIRLGFRPGSSSYQLDVEGSPFVNAENNDRGVTRDPVGPAINPLPGAVTALLDLWKNELKQ